MKHLLVTCDSFNSNISKGFSYLQQNEEFVDMTLVADGVLVKVHKSLMALTSPYLKAAIQSAPCQHPIVFLTNTSHKVLNYILEYVYTGEVMLPLDQIEPFALATKSLGISGFNDLLNKAQKSKLEFAETENEAQQTSMQNKDARIIVNKDLNVQIATHSMNSLQFNENEIAGPVENGYATLKPKIDIKEIVNLNSNQRAYSKIIVSDSGEVFNLSLQPDNNQDLIKDVQEETLIKVSDVDANVQASHTNLKTANNVDTSTSVRNPYFQIISVEKYREDYLSDAENVDMTDNDINYEEAKLNECVSNDNVIVEKTTSMDKPATKNKYSINVEMPTGSKGPPRITVNAGIIHNLPVPSVTDAMDIDTTGYGTCKTIPNITINNVTADSTNTSAITIVNPVPAEKSQKESEILGSTSPLYITTTKGSLQMILNRYIYGIQYSAKNGKKFRWRCIDYRRIRCPAYVDSVGERIIERKFHHKHGFHDAKILQRGSKAEVFQSLVEAFNILDQNIKDMETSEAEETTRAEDTNT